MLSFVTCHSLPINLMTADHSTGCKPYLVCKLYDHTSETKGNLEVQRQGDN